MGQPLVGGGRLGLLNATETSEEILLGAQIQQWILPSQDQQTKTLFIIHIELNSIRSTLWIIGWNQQFLIHL